MSASTPTQPAGGPPVPPVKPILSSPGAYMANFQTSSNSIGGVGSSAAAVTGTPAVAPITAGIHSSNKTHEKPTIAARPIPPPTLPKYSSSFNKIDRDRNEFTKLDKAEREKLQSKREMFFKSESNSPSGPPPNPPVLGNLNLANNNVVNNSASHLNNANNSTNNSSNSDKHSLNSHTNNSSSVGGANNSIVPNNMNNTNNNHNNNSINHNNSNSNSGVTSNGTNGAGVNGLANSLNNISLKEKRDAILNSNHHGDGLLIQNNGHHDSNKILNERHEKEKAVVKFKP